MTHIELVNLAALAIGLLFGACGQVTGFCLQRGLKEYWSGSDGYKLHAFAMALAVALAGTQALAAAGLVDLGKSLYMMPTWSWLLMPLGGLMFGYGMGMANGCGARALVLLGQGNLRSLIVLLCLGISAYMTLTGVLGPVRLALADISTIAPPWLAVPSGWASGVVTVLVAGALLRYALRASPAGGQGSENVDAPSARARDLAGG